MKTKGWAIILILCTTLLTSAAQIFYKIGVRTLDWNLVTILTNYSLITGMTLYAIGALMMILAFRGGEVTVLYPIFATSYIWVSFLSMVFLDEKLTFLRWIGIFIIISGISLISFGSSQKIRGNEHGS